MAQKPFLIFVIILLLCSIILILVVRNLAVGFADKGKKPFLYALLAALIVAAASFLISYLNGLFEIFWFLGFLFLIFGLIHLLYVPKRYFYSYKNRNKSVFGAELLFGCSIILFSVFVFSLLQYYVKHNVNYYYYPLTMSSLAFFIPIFVLHTFQAAYEIPEAEYETWQYPVGRTLYYPENNRDRLLLVGFKILKTTSGARISSVLVKVPENMKLGDMFYHFLNRYNEDNRGEKIEYISQESEAYEWWFRRKPKWYQGNRIFDPELSFKENKIKENTVIICERLQPIIQEYT